MQSNSWGSAARLWARLPLLARALLLRASPDAHADRRDLCQLIAHDPCMRRDAEVLSLFAAIITKLRELMAPEVPRVFEAIFECTLQMITKNFAVGGSPAAYLPSYCACDTPYAPCLCELIMHLALSAPVPVPSFRQLPIAALTLAAASSCMHCVSSPAGSTATL